MNAATPLPPRQLAVPQNELPWIAVARGYLGLAEIPGRGDAPVIQRWLRNLGAWWTDDATPWCGVYIAACVRETPPHVALPPPPKAWYRARAWADWGYPVRAHLPTYGSLLVLDGGPKRPGAGHVTWCVGEYQDGRLAGLGGNQSDRVTIAPFDPERVIAVRYPLVGWIKFDLPKLAANGVPSSQHEA